eukprot:scaffold1117_cov73-Skeletonema_marinoi.AAC.3
MSVLIFIMVFHQKKAPQNLFELERLTELARSTTLLTATLCKETCMKANISNDINDIICKLSRLCLLQ